MTSGIALFVQCDNLAEAKIAYDAISSFRKGETAPQTSDEPNVGLDDRIEAALMKAPLNRQRELILEKLLMTATGTWLSYQELQAAFEQEGFKKEQAQAALRDLSWQMKEHLHPEDLRAVPRAIEVLADRVRTSGFYQYRLTNAGRIAVERFLEGHNT